MLVEAAYIAGILTVVIGIWYVPSISIAVVLLMFGIEQLLQSTSAVFTRNEALVNYFVMLVVLVAVVAHFIRTHSLNIGETPPVAWVVIALLAYTFTSVFWSPIPTAGLDQWSKYWYYILAFVLVLPMVISRIGDFKHTFYSLLAIGSITVVLLLFTTEWHGRHIVLQGFTDYRGGNPLAVAQAAGYVAITAVLLNAGRGSILWTSLRWTLVALCAALIIMSGSRGQLIALGGLLIALLPMSRGVQDFRKFATFAVGTLFLGALILGGLVYFTQDTLLQGVVIEGRWAQEDMAEALETRFEASKKLLSSWFSTPPTMLFGLGNFASFDPRIVGFYPHNVPVEILGEEGMIGFSLFLAIVWFCFLSIKRTYHRTKENVETRGILAVLTGLFLFELILSFKQGSLVGSWLLFLNAILIGKFEHLVSNEKLPNDKRSRANEPQPVR